MRFRACRLADYHPDGKKIPVAKDLEADKWCGPLFLCGACRTAVLAGPILSFLSLLSPLRPLKNNTLSQPLVYAQDRRL